MVKFSQSWLYYAPPESAQEPFSSCVAIVRETVSQMIVKEAFVYADPNDQTWSNILEGLWQYYTPEAFQLIINCAPAFGV